MEKQMQVFKKILVATDFSDCASAALAQAVWLARQAGAEIAVAHIIPVTQETMATFASNPWYVAGNAAEIEERMRHAIDKRLREAITPYQASGVIIHRKTLLGNPIVEIIQAVQDEDYDLVVVGTRGLSAVSRFLIGSTASKLARKCPGAVWIAKQSSGPEFSTILAPVDFSELSRKSLELAANLSAQTGCSLHVLHVFTGEDPFPLDLLQEDTDMEVAAKRRLQRRQAFEQLRGFVAESSLPVEPTLHVERGEPWKRILSTAKRIDAALTVLGTVGRGGVAGLLIGNTAEKVLHSGVSSVLTVKPDDFVSPIHLRQTAAQA